MLSEFSTLSGILFFVCGCVCVCVVCVVFLDSLLSWFFYTLFIADTTNLVSNACRFSVFWLQSHETVLCSRQYLVIIKDRI